MVTRLYFILIYRNNLQPVNSKQIAVAEKYAETTVAILPSDNREAEEIIANIKNVKSSRGGSDPWDDWFFGASVYLSSTIYYSTDYINGERAGGIDYVTISCRTNSGISISSMSLRMGQIGYTPYDGYTGRQNKTFDATTRRTFYAPSSWSMVRWNDSSDVGAHLTCTAKRPSGESSTFTLYHPLKGAAS